MKKMSTLKFALLSFIGSLSLTSSVYAVTVAVIDSGVDTRHETIANNAWQNLLESDNGIDDDRNGFVDDLVGWNFAEDNNEIFDYEMLPLFTEDIKKFFMIQYKYAEGNVTQEELAWARQQLSDPRFLEVANAMGGYIHGTHVSGITLGKNRVSKILPIKLLSTKIRDPQPPTQPDDGDEGESELAPIIAQGRAQGLENVSLVKFVADVFARSNNQAFMQVARYVGDKGAVVANGSYGTGYKQGLGLAKALFMEVLKRSPTALEMQDVAKYFISQLLAYGKISVGQAPQTLFVYAAGNDGTDNDRMPCAPTNIVAENVISVGATAGYTKLATFSNYGINTVDVAAPGVNIFSSVPGGGTLPLSGTSQAAPFVSRVAAEIKAQNSALTPKEVKMILMQTVDVKDFLATRIRSSGIVNPARAVMAARLSVTNPLERAIATAKLQVADVAATLSEEKAAFDERDLFVLPLQSPFIF